MFNITWDVWQCIVHLYPKCNDNNVKILGREAPNLIYIGKLTLTSVWRMNWQGRGLELNAQTKGRKREKGRWKWWSQGEKFWMDSLNEFIAKVIPSETRGERALWKPMSPQYCELPVNSMLWEECRSVWPQPLNVSFIHLQNGGNNSPAFIVPL